MALALLPPSSPAQDGELTDKNCSVAVVGRDMPFTLLEDEALLPYIEGGWQRWHGGGQFDAAVEGRGHGVIRVCRGGGLLPWRHQQRLRVATPFSRCSREGGRAGCGRGRRHAGGGRRRRGRRRAAGR